MIDSTAARRHGTGRQVRAAIPGTGRTTHCSSGSRRRAGEVANPPIGAMRAAGADAQTVIYRLEEAGRSLLALPNTGYSTRLRLSSVEFIRLALDSYGWDASRGDARLRPPVPDAARISRMDEALSWITKIPVEKYVIRRVIGCRSLVSPVTERHLFAWRRIGALLGADHKAVQRWHAQGIDMIVDALNAPAQVDCGGRGRRDGPLPLPKLRC